MIKRGLEIRSLRSRKAALELSMTTVITIVLSVVFLILALTLLRNMYGFQTESVTQIQKKTLEKINALYLGDEEVNTKLWFVNVADNKVVNIRADGNNFGIGLMGVTLSNAPIQNDSDVYFKFWLDEVPADNCVKLNTKAKVESWFKSKPNTPLICDQIVDSTCGVSLILAIPTGTRLCQQKVYVQGWDKVSGANPAGDTLGKDYFIIDVLRKSPFS